MNCRADKLMIDAHTDIHTHAGNDNTRRPRLASGKNWRGQGRGYICYSKPIANYKKHRDIGGNRHIYFSHGTSNSKGAALDFRRNYGVRKINVLTDANNRYLRQQLNYLGSWHLFLSKVLLKRKDDLKIAFILAPDIYWMRFESGRQYHKVRKCIPPSLSKMYIHDGGYRA